MVSIISGGFESVSEQFVKFKVKLRELSLSYKPNLTTKLGLESVTFTGTGRNLWLWTERADLDKIQRQIYR
jgi:hypothetical protein